MNNNKPNNKKIIAKQKFQEIQKLFKRLSDNMGRVVESYYIWKTLVFSKSIPEVGEEKAKKNVETMTPYKDFFYTTEHNCMDAFIIGILKFFDKNPRSLSIQKLKKKIKENQNIITIDTLKEIYPSIPFDEDFKKK
jgi:hypothetical protein